MELNQKKSLEIRVDANYSFDNLHNQLEQEVLPGYIHCLPFTNHRDYFLHTKDQDIPVARVFPQRYLDFQPELTQAAVDLVKFLANNQTVNLFLPPNSVFSRPTRFKEWKMREIYAVEETPDVVRSYKIEPNN